MTERTILHIDMNAFFASVEQEANPELRGKPIAVIGSAGRTVITTASYEARAFGVRTGMNVYEGRRACPQLILVVGNNRRYTRISTSIMAILREFTPLVEVFSIDEAFLDITGCFRLFGPPSCIAASIKERIRDSFGLTCSIGIAPNKLLAKLASEMKKPDGLTIIRPEEVAHVLEKVPVRDLCGIGRHVERDLSLLGIGTCGQLGRFPVEILIKKFGVTGERLNLMGRGMDDAPVVPDEEGPEVKSVGHTTTLARDVVDRAEIGRQLLRLAEMVGRRARSHGVEGKTVTLTVRYADFTTFSRQLTRPSHTNGSRELYDAALELVGIIALAQPVRLLGVKLSGLRRHESQLSLFQEERKNSRATAAMDLLNDRFGEFTVTYGTIIDEAEGSQVISPSWRPEGIRKVDVS